MNIVLMKESEKNLVKSIAYKAFQPFFRLVISLKGKTWLAKEGEEILGGVVVKTFETRGIKNGFVAFLFTNPEYKQKGVGHILTKKAVEDLKEQGCSRIFTTIEGNNTNSERVFYSANLRPVNFLEQINLFSFDLLKIIFHTGHYFDIGYRLWTDVEVEGKKVNNLSTLMANILLNTLIMTLILFRSNRFGDYVSIFYYLLSFSIVFSSRFIIDFVLNKTFKIQAHYRLWDSGFYLNLLIGGLFGGYCPNPGAFYPKDNRWNYREYKSKLGKISAINMIMQFVLFLTFYYSNFTFKDYFLFVSTTTLVVDLLPFAPFDIFNGRRLWKDNKILWLLLTLPILSIIFILK